MSFVHPNMYVRPHFGVPPCYGMLTLSGSNLIAQDRHTSDVYGGAATNVGYDLKDLHYDPREESPDRMP